MSNEFDVGEALRRSFIDPDTPVDEPPTILKFGGRQVATLGNFSVITGKAKSRKTFFTTLILAANAGCEVPGIEITQETRAAFMDTEQSRYDTAKVQQRIALMGGDPRQTCFFSLRQFTPKERKAMIAAFVISNPNIKLIFIDGVRDLVFDINSAHEAMEVIGWLMKLSADQNIHICLVLHQNKGDNNVRGHLGTEAVNKAETVLSVTKDKDISIVRPEHTRSREFAELAFTVEDIDEMGIPKITSHPDFQINRDTRERQATDESVSDDAILTKAFEGLEKPRYGELLDALKQACTDLGVEKGESYLKRLIGKYKAEGKIVQHGKQQTSKAYYELVNPG